MQSAIKMKRSIFVCPGPPQPTVSAFRQVGICSREEEQGNSLRRTAYTDPSVARLVKKEAGLFTDAPSVPRPPRRQLKICDLELESQRLLALQEHQQDEGPGERAPRTTIAPALRGAPAPVLAAPVPAAPGFRGANLFFDV